MESSQESADPFSDTHWSMVQRAQDGSHQALDAVLSTYREPILKHLIRHLGIEEGEDACHDYLCQLIQSGYLQKASQEHGKFRAFLLHDLRFFILDRRRRMSAAKRGGKTPRVSLEHAEEEGVQFEGEDGRWRAEEFDEDWARNLMKQAIAKLEAIQRGRGTIDRFRVLSDFLEEGGSDEEYQQAARALSMTPNAVSTAVSRLRQRLAVELRSIVAETVAPTESISEELNYLRRCYLSANQRSS